MPQDFPFSTPPMATPPIMPEPMTQPPARSTWPTVVGILAIVFGAVTIIFGVFGLVSTSFEDFFLSSMSPEQAAETQRITASYQPWMIGSACVALVLAILLLVSGIGVVQRRRPGARRLRVWAYLSIPYAVAAMIMQAVLQSELIEVTQAGIGPTGTPGVLEEIIVVPMLLFGLAWSCAGPVFVLVWFSRKSIKAEVADWA
ncbi:MAG: hypothetical protein JXA69_11900 [Phycisphaerae bacterium]|nr:hypothetical protein [Phycisphaerae bacterium]